MIRDLLTRYNIRPKTERGQHFLDDSAVVEQMVEAAELEEDETVLEIGAGVGTITRQLADTAGTVIAYENDAELARVLRSEMDVTASSEGGCSSSNLGENAATYDSVEVREEDALKADVPAFDACVSNIPFHRSSDVLDFLVDRGKRSVLLVQEEFAQRLVAEPGDDQYSRTTVLANYRFLPVYLDQVPQRSFHPEMDVDAALVKLFPRNDSFDVDEDWFRTVTKALFTHSGKKTRNAFVDSAHMLDIDDDTAERLRDELPHAQDRVRTLDVHAFVDIATFLDKSVH
ncbi:MAG: 16S rRNA (adenine(1518)-N(6)/adenine(1519)-N(6))-dimethyltransferase RsmA [Candidatus Nanohaloarchaea archaeon]|nr:16S rRNA (adenine(1518)-N(6)/adenine(1519)-N(6))-dimethyltransferase RsmA [Candidatus Nanohaloarchaea archaeon]